MEKEKSLLYSMFEKFRQSQESSKPKENDAIPVDKEVKTIPENKPTQTQTKSNAHINAITELCTSSGYTSDYAKGVNIADRANLQTALLPLAADYMKRKDANEDIDSSVFIFISRDKFRAYVFIFPAFNEGKKLDKEEINTQLNKLKITYGIKEDITSFLVDNNEFCKMHLIAEGEKSFDGTDGKLVEYIKVIKEATFIEGEDSRIDFKKLNLENNIIKDTPICKIIPHTLGKDGVDVHGKIAKAKAGKKLVSPAGKGTYIPENSNLLLAEIDGRLSYQSGKYNVETSFILNGNVDNSTGNIDFVGDVIVKGRVRSGFEIKAGGSIYIEGSAGDCILTAKGEIVIKDGINADNHGKLEAGSNITCKFIENCTVTSGGNITTGSIINSTVFADDSINVTVNKGVVLNSSLTAYNHIKAITLGSETSRDVRIVLGKSHTLAEEASKIKFEIPNTKKTIDRISKNIDFLEKSKELTEQKTILLNQLKEQLELYVTHLDEQIKRKDIIADLTKDCSRCKLETSTVYPPCKINIGVHNHWVKSVQYKTSFRVLDDEIKLIVN